MISKFIAAAVAAGLVLTVTGNADARSHHKKHHGKAMSAQAMSIQAMSTQAMSTQAMSTQAMSTMRGAHSNPNMAPQTTPREPVGKDSTAESPRR